MHIRIIAIVLMLGLAACVANQPQGDAATQRSLLLQKKTAQRLNDAETNPQLLWQINEYALVRVVRCQRCHEPEGRSKTPDMPFLAGQNPLYTIEQFLRYADGRRKDFNMRTLAATMSDDDMINLAIYYAKMPIRPAGGGTREQQEQGKRIFDAKCVACHGKDGRGKEAFPSLAGQRPKYVVKMLRAYRLGEKGRHNNPVMTPLAQSLKDEDMEAVAAYVANLR